MAALVSLLIAISLSLLITRIAAEVLALTGLSRESAEFQARSAFTGSGFTTSESEQVVAHPVRRWVLMWLMLLGNAGFITVISSLVLTFINTGSSQVWLPRLFVLILGIALLWAIAANHYFNRLLSRLVQWTLRRWTHLDVRDYANLLRLSGDYAVTELRVDADDWITDKPLSETNLRREGILVLGIHRPDGTYIGAPKGSTFIRPEDLLILYGRLKSLNELDSRKVGFLGEIAHRNAITDQQQILSEEYKQDFKSRSEGNS